MRLVRWCTRPGTALSPLQSLCHQQLSGGVEVAVQREQRRVLGAGARA